jgi:hypothetical protein
MQRQRAVHCELEEEMASVEQMHQLQLQHMRQNTADLQREIELLKIQDQECKVLLAAAQVRSM